jgi:hypothetical protein
VGVRARGIGFMAKGVGNWGIRVLSLQCRVWGLGSGWELGRVAYAQDKHSHSLRVATITLKAEGARA